MQVNLNNQMEVIGIIEAVIQATCLIYDTLKAVSNFYNNGKSNRGCLSALRDKLCILHQYYDELGPELKHYREEQGASKPHGLVAIMNRHLVSLQETLQLVNDQINGDTERGRTFQASPISEKQVKSLILRIDKEDTEVRHIMTILRE